VRDQVIASVLDAADSYIAHQSSNPFGQPYLPEDGTYVWGSWSTNELTINWNSVLAWVAAWAADQDDAKDCAHHD